MLRREKTVLQSILPPKIVSTIAIESHQVEMKLYQCYERKFLEKLQSKNIFIVLFHPFC